MTVPIYVIGSSNTDLVVKSEKLPRPGETVLGGTFFMSAGGKGANQAVAAARMGGSVTLVAHVGKDVFGQESVRHFQREKINTRYVSQNEEHPSGVALIVVDSAGENSISVAPGSNALLSNTHILEALREATPPSIVLLQMEIPLATVKASIETARSKGLTIILNPAPAQPLTTELISQLDFITPNETEAELLTGIKVHDLDTAGKAATKFLEWGVRNVVITLGAQGAYFQNNTSSRLVAAPKVKALDSTAAGDCFNGALVVALSENKSLEESVELACLAASISVTRLGAQTSMPFRNEVEALAHSLRKSISSK